MKAIDCTNNGTGMELVTLAHPDLLNTSCNDSSQDPWSPQYSPLETALIISAVVTIIVSDLVGNALVVVAICTSRALRAPQNLFLVSLASADILVGTLIIPFSLANEVMGYWYFGSVCCSLYLALDILLCTSSIVHLCAISLDRYWSVTKAVSYNQKRTHKRIRSMIAIVWLISAIIALPPLVMSKHRDQECFLNDDTWYVLVSCTVSFFAPCLIMLLVYCKIYRVAKQRTMAHFTAKTRALTQNPSHCGSVNGEDKSDLENASSHSSDYHQDPEELQDMDPEESSSSTHKPTVPKLSRHRSMEAPSSSGSKRNKSCSWPFSRGIPSWQQRRDQSISLTKIRLAQLREKRFTFVLTMVIGGFVICWFPFFFIYSLRSVCREACSISNTLFNFFFWIGYCNSSLNPILYTIFNRDFRKAFTRILCRTQRRGPPC